MERADFGRQITSSAACSGDEAVPGFPGGENMLWNRGIDFKLVTQSRDVLVHCARCQSWDIVPHFADHKFAGDDGTVGVDQEHEQFVLTWRELDRYSLACDCASAWINYDVPKTHHFISVACARRDVGWRV